MLADHATRRQRATIAGGASALLLVISIATAAATPTPTQARLQSALQQFAATHRTFPGVALAVRTPRVTWTGAAGTSMFGSRRPLSPNDPVRIASVTKTFVAAAILRLVEQGRLGLDEPAARRLDGETVALLRRGGYAVDAITVRELLRHTAGLYDYASDPGYERFVLAHGRHRWTRIEQLRFAIEHGKPLSPPGRVFHYSDTGYILLGEILERTTHHDLGWALSHLLRFGRLGLNHTSLDTPESTSSQPRAHQYYDRIDTTRFDASFDLYGGGGLVSTVDDLARFYQALVAGRIFDQTETLRTLLGKTNPRRVSALGMGIFSTRIAGLNCWAHSGFWGTTVLTCPRIRTTLALSVNQADGFDRPSQRLLTHLLLLLR